MRKKEKGITLIALIITVIVMLILAGVAINLTIGENGIFKKSSEGAEIYKNSANAEASSLNEVDELLGNMIKYTKRQEITNKGTIECSITWENKKASMSLGTTSEYKVQYQVNGEKEESWIEGTQVNELNLNDIVYARLYDGELAGNSIKIVIEDTQQPNEANISVSATTIAVGKPMKVTIIQSDNQSGVKIEECKWIFTTQKEGIENYTGTFSSESEEIEIVATEEKMYYLHILTLDNAGNKMVTVKEMQAIIPPGRPDENDIFTENSTINGEEGTAFNPEIPKGFKPVDVGDAIWGSEEGYKKGLVIQDVEGNQFVWVAVDGEVVKLDRYTFASNGAEQPQGEAILDSFVGHKQAFQERTVSIRGETVSKDINAFKCSVVEHGGYYFARYEASNGGDGKPNSKVAYPWINISQQVAANASRNMYGNDCGAISDLVNSYAWDTTLVYIQKYSGYTAYSKQQSSNKAIYANTGTTGDKRCNIFDMASNAIEYTTESIAPSSSMNNACICAARGGGVDMTICAGDRAVGRTDDTKRTFRPILYL